MSEVIMSGTVGVRKSIGWVVTNSSSSKFNNISSRVLRDSMNRYVGRSVGLSVGGRRFFRRFWAFFCITAPAFSCFVLVFWSFGFLVL